MNTTAATESVKFTISAKGQRNAQIWWRHSRRWVKVNTAKADLMVATGEAEDVTAEWSF